ncbi:MAG TPA: PDZ domain-containing protein [Dermatophilaceae bacterium]
MTDTRDETVLTVEQPGNRLSWRSTSWILAVFVGIMLGALMGVIHLPYAILQPGPVTNTLGNGPEGKPLITVAGEKSYPTTGALDFTTVAVLGGPRSPVNGWDWIGAHLDKTSKVVPEEELFPKGVTSKEVDHESAAEMADSQQEAIAVALRGLGETVPEVVSIGALTKDSPAKGVLLPGDVVLAIDGKAVTTPDSVRAAVRAHKPGQSAVFTVRRGGKEKALNVTTTDSEGHAVVGILLRTAFLFPTKVSINAGDVGGPSAGMMFSLAIYDKLTPGSLTGGNKIAGTGTIDSAGTVGPIGGIQQKLVGAKRGGAAWFLAPAGNCNEVVGHIPEGLKVVRVGTFTQARDAVEAIAAKHTDALPTCK